MAHHLIQRGNNRQPCFHTRRDFRSYLSWLHEYALFTDCHIHAFVLMTNHTHLLVTPHYPDSISELMKRLGQRYTQYFNKNYRRSGTLWEGRFRSCIVQQDSYVLYCYRYIELNPVRASMVKHPAEYPWSSYRVNAQSDPSGLITPHTTYSSLGQTETDRVVAYRHLFAERLDDGVIDDIRDATNGNLVVGCDQFKKDVELSLGRRVFPRRAGRPPKSGSDPN